MFRYRNALMFQLLAIFLAWMLMNMHVSPVAASPLPPEKEAPGELVRLPGHTLSALKGATPVAPLPGAGEDPLTLTVVLKRTDQAGFDRYLHEVYDSHSPAFRHFLSQGEIAEQFGPKQEAYEGVLAYLQRNGFTLVQGSANRLTLTVRGTRAEAERAFGVHIGDYEAGGRRFFANDTDPAVPYSLARDIRAVTGLSNQATPQPSQWQVPAAIAFGILT
jgi:subtilase family serine protease